MRKTSILNLFLCLIFLMAGCGNQAQTAGSIIPNPDDPGEIIVIPPEPIEVVNDGMIVPPMAPVKSYRGG